MPEKKEKKRDDLDEKEEKRPSPFEERKIDEEIIKDIDDLVEKTGEEGVEKRRDEEGE